jgi:hypothetical protein
MSDLKVGDPVELLLWPEKPLGIVTQVYSRSVEVQWVSKTAPPGMGGGYTIEWLRDVRPYVPAE